MADIIEDKKQDKEPVEKRDPGLKDETVTHNWNSVLGAMLGKNEGGNIEDYYKKQ
jgi:hypothetical protein